MVDESLPKIKTSSADKLYAGLLTEFYEMKLGWQVRRALRLILRRCWPDVRGLRVLGLGHASVYLKPFLNEARQVLALDTLREQPFPWPRKQACRTALVDAEALPLPSRSIDLMLLVHGLEVAANPAAILAEAERVLAASGRLMLIVPHRLGLWAHADHTPFGEGYPFSVQQARRLLEQQGLVLTRAEQALWFPPFRGRLWLYLAPSLEKVGHWLAKRLGLACGGVLLLEARPQAFAPILQGNAGAPALVPRQRTPRLGREEAAG